MSVMQGSVPCVLPNCFILTSRVSIYVSQYAPGANISPFIKGVEQSIHFGISAQSNHSYSIDQAHVWPFLPKCIMMALEHHLAMSWWHKGFKMMSFISVLRGFKRRMQERIGGFCSSSSWVQFKVSVSLPKSTLVHLGTGLVRNFYIQAKWCVWFSL